MKNLFVLFTFALTVSLPACKKPIAAIRNPDVYANEIDFNNMVQNQAVSHLHYWLEANCSCNEVPEWVGDHAEQCEKTAKHITVVEARQEWHTAMMEYNGSLREDRPPKDPPEIPESTTLCPEKAEEPAPEPEKPAGESTEGSEGGI